MDKLTMKQLIDAIDTTSAHYETVLLEGAFDHDAEATLKMEGVLIGIKCVKGLIIEMGV